MSRLLMCCVFFFKQKTAYDMRSRDSSSDVCSSDLLMALRLARAHTGRGKLVRFLGHFHGWQDHVAFGVSNHFDGTPTPGVLPGIAENVLLVCSEGRRDGQGCVRLCKSWW